MRYTLYNVDYYYIYLNIYDTDNNVIMGYNLYKEDVQFFLTLKNNLHNKDYTDKKSNEVLNYVDETLLFKFIIDDKPSIFSIDDKDFIKRMCESIITEAIKMNIISS